MPIEDAILAKPNFEWLTDQVIVFDWHDGPRQGVARLTVPQCEFMFDLIAERFNPDGLDDRLFRLFEIPAGSFDAIARAIQSLGNPKNLIWTPVWIFPNDDLRLHAEQEIARISAQKRDMKLILYSRDMIEFKGIWSIKDEVGEIKDWFLELGIP